VRVLGAWTLPLPLPAYHLYYPAVPFFGGLQALRRGAAVQTPPSVQDNAHRKAGKRMTGD